MNIVIGIATAGRRDILSATVKQLSKQTRLPDCLCICPASPDDVDLSCLRAFPASHVVVDGARGSSHQRNAIMRSAKTADIIVFFDDDFLVDPSYLAEAEKLFADHPHLVVATGRVIADGASGPGISVEQGLVLLAAADPPSNHAGLVSIYSGYGCNMAVRVAVARLKNIEFDEKLPLYGWWEDVDFCRRLSRFGAIGRSGNLQGIHLGSKKGKTPGKRLGYSQVANLLYMVSKGSISRRVAMRKISANVLANCARSLFPELWVDRRGRLIGNLIAFADLIKGTLSPENILKMR